MSKTVLISIQPKWCELIANGIKTIEVRKTRPKLDTPFRCYIYCTKKSYKGKYLHTSNKRGKLLFWNNPDDTTITVQPEDYNYMAYTCRGKVIGEFVCDSIITIFFDSDIRYGQDFPNKYISKICNDSCLSLQELKKYADGKDVYGWHISDLVIYDKPRELSEFHTICNRSGNTDDSICRNCTYFCFDDCPFSGYTRWCSVYKRKPLIRPPQSWCYVEGWGENVIRDKH